METEILITLRNILIGFYSDEASIRRILDDSGMKSWHINYKLSVQNVWHSILKEAEKIGEIDDLLIAIKSEYGSNKEFQNIYDAYYRSTEPTVCTQSDEQDQKKIIKAGIDIPNRRCSRVYGREEFIDILTYNLLKPVADSRVFQVFSITGSAGYGKSEVAAEFARSALDQRHFQKVVWVTARQTDLFDGIATYASNQTSLQLNDFFGQVAKQLQCELGQIQNRLKSKNILIVLDNAETSNAQAIVTKLVPMLNPSKLILTTRFDEAMPSVKPFIIRGLDKKSATELLRDEAKERKISCILQASQLHLDKLFNISQGAPLALHFIVGRAYYDRDLDTVIDAFNAPGKDIEKFYRFCLEIAWSRISECAKDVLRCMGHVADASVNISQIRNYLVESRGVSFDQVRDAIINLRGWHLIEGENSQLDLHPWVRRSIRGNLIDDWIPSEDDIEILVKHALPPNKE